MCCTLHFLHGEIQIIERKERVISISGFPAFDQPLELVNRRSGDGVSACPKSPTVESLMPKSPDFASPIVSLVPHSPRDGIYGATHLCGSSRRCVLRRMNELGTEQRILGSRKLVQPYQGLHPLIILGIRKRTMNTQKCALHTSSFDGHFCLVSE